MFHWENDKCDRSRTFKTYARILWLQIILMGRNKRFLKREVQPVTSSFLWHASVCLSQLITQGFRKSRMHLSSPTKSVPAEKSSSDLCPSCQRRKCRQLQDEASALQREVTLLEQRLDMRRNEALLSAVALKKFISARSDLIDEMEIIIETYNMMNLAPEMADRAIDALLRQAVALEDENETLKIKVRTVEEELKRCDEENRSLLKQLGKEREQSDRLDKGKQIQL